jgi:hypothetical protein
MTFRPPKAHEFLTIVVYDKHPYFPDMFVAFGHYYDYQKSKMNVSKESIIGNSYAIVARQLRDLGFIKGKRFPEDCSTVLENWV